MNEKEALTRVKTGDFNGGYGFDMQLLVDAVGIIGEMFKSGKISEVVRCKDCRKWNERLPKCDKTGKLGYGVNDFCSKAERKTDA